MPIGPAYGNDLSGEYVFTGNVEFPNGTAAAPSIRGVNDLDTGWAWLGSNVLIASTGGTERVRIDASGVLTTSSNVVSGANFLTAVSGSASFPSHSFFSDTDTGMFRAGTNALGLSATGTEMARLTTAGLRIQNGVSAAASYLLHVVASGSANALTVDNTTGTTGFMGAPVTSAAVAVTSTTLGFLPPRMTTTQRDAITSPATGLVIYNTTTNVLNFYNGSAWGAV